MLLAELRQVGLRYKTTVVAYTDCDAEPGPANAKRTNALLDDVVDLLACGLPDVLLEYAIDAMIMCEGAGRPIVQDDDVIYEAFYAMVDAYIPELNK